MKLVAYFPIVSMLLLEFANVGQVIQMFRVQSSLGQSLMSYLMVITALCLWERFYSIRTPNERSAIWATRIGIVVNAFVAASVLYFR